MSYVTHGTGRQVGFESENSYSYFMKTRVEGYFMNGGFSTEFCKKSESEINKKYKNAENYAFKERCKAYDGDANSYSNHQLVKEQIISNIHYDGGLETVSHPADLEYWRHSGSLERIFDDINMFENGHWGNGFHVHVYSKDLPDSVKVNVLNFVEKNVQTYIYLARRKPNWACNKTFVRKSKFQMVNVDHCSGKTIEFRMFCGTNDPRRAMLNMVLSLATVEFCHEIPVLRQTWENFTYFCRDKGYHELSDRYPKTFGEGIRIEGLTLYNTLAALAD